MPPTERKQRRRRRSGSLVRWHRRIGLAAVVFFVVLAVTGILIGHADRLGLTRATADWAPIRALYGQEPQQPPIAFETADGWIAWIDGTLFLGARPILRDAAAPIGAVAASPFTAVAGPGALYLFDGEGALVERMADAALPGSPTALGLTGDGRLALRTGDEAWQSDKSMLGWQRLAEPARAEWSNPDDLPPARRARVMEAWRGPAPHWDRVLADVHTGRIIGPIGPWIVDLASLALLALAATGLVQWLRRR